MSFSHVMSTDFGFYNCSAVNAYGSDWQTIELRRDGKLIYFLVHPILKDELSIASLSGIIAALVAAVFFALLLFFYCRRRQYPKPSLKGKTLSKVTGRQNSEFLNNSYGYTRTNKLPQMLGADSKDDTFYFQSSSGSTDAETLSRYHLPSTTIRGSSEHAGLTAQSPSSIASTPITDQCLSVRPFSPVCKYTLIDGSGQNIPVCPNVVTFTGQPGDLHLTSEGGAALCIASDYQPIPITYVNLPAATRMASVAQEGPIAQRVGVVPATPVLPDSDIIVNTQVTDV
uniref:Ig-like domain-containing protein n=1 Tax=Mesocestoides corti TaxID=53468 RepID=A0A5K3FUI3_MESCO